MSKLFQPFSVGNLTLSHRIVLAPMARFRSNINGVQPDRAIEYYAQRASTPGTLLFTEATLIAPKAGGYSHASGIWSDEQIESWKMITDAVHKKGSYIFLQIVALGRAASLQVLEAADPRFPYISSGDVQLQGTAIAPRSLTKEEIQEYVRFFATGAKHAVERAGFDGVELHGANGFLLDQFLSNVTNNRHDEYGGGPEGRAKFSFEVIEAVVQAVGQERTGYRISPWNTVGDLRMDDASLKSTFTYFVKELGHRYPRLAYLHATESRPDDDEGAITKSTDESNDFIREIWAPRPFISAGGYTRETAIEASEMWPNQLIAFGRHFLSTPDLPRRVQEGIPFNKYDRSTFYVNGDSSATGYTDYPFATVVA